MANDLILELVGAAAVSNQFQIGKWLDPNTNQYLNFFPGLRVASTNNAAVSAIQTDWDLLFNSTRKTTWRPPGLYGSVVLRASWKEWYADPTVRPTNPLDHTDPAYKWTPLTDLLAANCVAVDGAKISIEASDRYGSGSPFWIRDTAIAYQGTWTGANAAVDVTNGYLKYWRYGTSRYNHAPVNAQYGPPITDEYLYFVEALAAKIASLGVQDKIAEFGVGEVNTGDNTPYPSDYNQFDYNSGVIYRDQNAAKIFAAIGIICVRGSPGSSSANPSLLGGIVNSPNLIGVGSPDPKMFNSGYPVPVNTSAQYTMYISRDIRPVTQAAEANGLKAYSVEPPIAMPSGRHINELPTPADYFFYFGKNGPLPVHTYQVSLRQSATNIDPTWKQVSAGGSAPTSIGAAYDAYGPAGNKTCPYLPAGYRQFVSGY